MIAKNLFRLSVSVVILLSVFVLVPSASASALAQSNNKAQQPNITHIVHKQFAATGFFTSFTSTITEPPHIGQNFILEENIILNSTNTQIGTDHIKCLVTGFSQTMPRVFNFACDGTFTFTDGTIRITAFFSSDQVNYDARVVGGTGAYATVVPALSVIHVTDHGPFTPTGYSFDLLLL